MIQAQQNKTNLKMFVAELADEHYYNNDQKIIRVKIGKDAKTIKYFDLYFMQGTVYPNPNDHYALVATTEQIFNGTNYAIQPGDPRLDNIPGYKDESNFADVIGFGFVWLIDKRINNNTTNYNDTSTGMFNQEANLPSDPTNVKYSLSPSLNKDYTTTKAKDDGDQNNDNIGIFITDNSVLIKSEAASILVGPQGISFLGDKFESHTKGGKGMMMDNPFHGWFPSTMMTVPLGIGMIPNYNFIISVGTAARILTKGMSAIKKTTSNVKNFIG